MSWIVQTILNAGNQSMDREASGSKSVLKNPSFGQMSFFREKETVMNEWVTGVKIAFTVNGKFWDYVNDGQVFQGNSDRTTKVRTTFEEPIYARAIRVYPISWVTRPSLRFEVVYVDVK